jgi:hypothetical protein
MNSAKNPNGGPGRPGIIHPRNAKIIRKIPKIIAAIKRISIL